MIETKHTPDIFNKWDDPEFRESLRKDGYEELILRLNNTNQEKIVKYLAFISDFPEESIFQKSSRNSYLARHPKNANYTPDIEVKKINEDEYIIRYNSKTIDSKIISQLKKEFGEIK